MADDQKKPPAHLEESRSYSGDFNEFAKAFQADNHTSQTTADLISSMNGGPFAAPQQPAPATTASPPSTPTSNNSSDTD